MCKLLSRHLKFTVRRHKSNKDSLSYRNAVEVGLALLLPPRVLLERSTPALVLTLHQFSLNYLLSAVFYFLCAVDCFLFSVGCFMFTVDSFMFTMWG